MNDATKILDSLRPEEIRARLDALSREQKALRTLLRAAILRERPRSQSDIKGGTR